MVDSQAEYDAVMGKTAAASASNAGKKPTQESSSDDELTASTPALQANKMFDTFMKRRRTDVLSRLNDQQFHEYVRNLISMQ